MAPRKDIDKSFFADGFDIATRLKLDIYADYLQEWLPVPLSRKMGVTEAVIYDLFCGPGEDRDGTPGSPLRARDVILHNEQTILRSDVQVKLVFNDHLQDHIDELRSKLGDSIISESGNELADIEYHARPFDEILPKLVDSRSRRSAGLFFIDQFGATSVGPEEFRTLRELQYADVLIYIASDFFRRFSGTREATEWGIDREEILNTPYRQLHRFMVSHVKRMIGEGYHMAPFSLKKQSNIYGLIFACRSYLGLEKFLRVAWSKDPHTGEANHDLFGDSADDRAQSQLIDSIKVEQFQIELREKILTGDFDTDKEIYLFMLESGFLTQHAKPVVRGLRGQIEFRDGQKPAQPRLSKTAMKSPRQLVLLR